MFLLYMKEIQVDIQENDILRTSPELLAMLLKDHTTQGNFLCKTDNYVDSRKETLLEKVEALLTQKIEQSKLVTS